jgi:hypothetical protein
MGKANSSEKRRLTKEQKAEIVRLYEAGSRVGELAKRFGAKQGCISAMLRRRGVPIPKRATCKDCAIRPRYRNHSRCLECLRPIMTARMAERRKKHNAAGVCRDCGRPRDTEHGHCLHCLTRHRRTTISFKQRNKIKCFEAYGGCRCACCGEASNIDFLTIDHINDNGAEHRRMLSGTKDSRGQAGHVFYSYLKRNNYPPGYQVLCFNCQWGKRLGNGICLHQRNRDLFPEYVI